MLINRCTMLLIGVFSLAGCSEETQPERILSDAEMFDGTVYMEFLKVSPVTPESHGAAFFNVTNNTDYAIFFVNCDAFGYANDELVAQEYDQYLFTRYGLDDYGKPELEPGQTRAASVLVQDRLSSTQMDRIEVTCTYQASGSNSPETFRGGSRSSGEQ